ncbi:MAG: hypothetical protein CL610_24610 [Anaerolineaceae bacterium]|nr:hypothetical protein [Anaerolineaceae bacterium]
MLGKLLRSLFGESHSMTSDVTLHQSGQLAMLSTRELDRRRMYERMVAHQRLSEIEEKMSRR